jgi:hypothetical protein
MRVDDMAGDGAVGMVDIARHVMGCHVTQHTMVEMRVDDVAVTCRADQSLARHIKNASLTQEARVQRACRRRGGQYRQYARSYHIVDHGHHGQRR